MRIQKKTSPKIKLIYPYKNKRWFEVRELPPKETKDPDYEKKVEAMQDDYSQAKEIDYQLLRRLKNDVTRAKNIGIETLYREVIVQSDFRELARKYMKLKATKQKLKQENHKMQIGEITEEMESTAALIKSIKSNAGKKAYKEMREYGGWMSSNIISCAVDDVKKHFYNWYKNRYKQSIPHFKDQPIPIPSRDFRIRQDENGYSYLDFCVFSKWTRASRMRLGLLLVDYSKQIVENLWTKQEKPKKAKTEEWEEALLKEGQFVAGEANILWDDGKTNDWVVQFSYNRQIEEKKGGNISVGVDLGMTYAFYAAVSNSWKRLRFKGGKLKHKRKQMQAIKNSLGEASKGGYGTQAVWKRKLNLGHQEGNFILTCYHQYTSVLTDFAVRNNASIVYIEDHEQLGECLFTSWSPAIFFRLLKYKLNEAGIQLIEIAPQYTSQRCFNCGFIHPNNRLRGNGDWFKCLNCDWGHFEILPAKDQYKQKINADYNSAKNISIGWTYNPKIELNLHVKLLSKKFNISEKEIKDSLIKGRISKEEAHNLRKKLSDLIIKDEIVL